MRYLSVCAGIEAATVAAHPLGWQPWAFSEIDAFPSAVLRHHYPDVPNLGNMTQFQEWPHAALDLLVGGTPCQSFSVAGLRAGLADPRGNLALVYLALADRYRPRWVVWENVPGVLSSSGGRDFGAFLGGLAELGYGFAYRVLDAQYFGLAQRRKRVFVVGYLGDWRRAAAVLFERASLSGHPAPRREAGEAAPTIPSRRTAGGGLGTDFDCDGGLIPSVANPLTARMGKGINTTCDEGQTMIAHSLRAEGFDASEDGAGQRTPLVPVAHAFDARQSDVIPVYFQDDTTPKQGSIVGALRRDAGGEGACVAYGEREPAYGGMQVRRLTPRECERLQGFPDNYTLIPYRGKPAADGPRYKALGNSMAVPVVRWIFSRIAQVDGLED